MKVAVLPWNFSHSLSDSVALTKPRITLLALVTTIVGMVIAPTHSNLPQTLFALVGVTLLVAGANALNMFLERDIDHRMDRTRYRPLPDKRLSPEYGLGLGSLLIGLSVPMLYFCVNPLTGAVGFLSLVTYLLIYTPLKRRTSWSLWVGAVPGAAPPLLGWTASTGHLAVPAWILFGIIFFWQIPHFLAIGTFRRDEYAAAGFKIFPQRAQPQAIKLQMVIFSFITVPVSLALYFIGYAGSLYLWTASLLNLIFVAVVLAGIVGKDERLWGKRVFIVSLIYLTALFLVIFLDGGPP
jgi:protoheme IX farnesyltransferase